MCVSMHSHACGLQVKEHNVVVCSSATRPYILKCDYSPSIDVKRIRSK